MTVFKNLSVRFKLYCLVGVFAVGFLGFGLSASRTLEQVKVNGPYYARIVQGKDLIADVLPPPEYLIESYLIVLQMANETDRQALDGLVNRSRTLRSDYEARHEYWVKELPPSAMKDALVRRSYQPAQEFFKAYDSDFLPKILAGDRAGANEVVTGVLKEKYAAHRAAVDEGLHPFEEGRITLGRKALVVVEHRPAVDHEFQCEAGVGAADIADQEGETGHQASTARSWKLGSGGVSTCLGAPTGGVKQTEAPSSAAETTCRKALNSSRP